MNTRTAAQTTEVNEAKIQRFLEQLELAGKRRTLQRNAICRALVESESHPTVAEIYNRVTAAFPMISQATVYNTIDTLRELGLIIRLDIANHDHNHYDIDTDPHVNLVCRYCGSISDVYDDTVDRLLEAVAERSGYRLTPEAGLIVYGICPRCIRSGAHSRTADAGEEDDSGAHFDDDTHFDEQTCAGRPPL